MTTAMEVTAETMPNEPEANKLFRMVMRYKGSDLHLKVGLAPAMRLAGVLRLMQLPQISAADMERLMFPLLSPRQRNILAALELTWLRNQRGPLRLSSSSCNGHTKSKRTKKCPDHCVSIPGKSSNLCNSRLKKRAYRFVLQTQSET